MNLQNFIWVYFIVTATLLGVIIGSFLNVVIYRIPAGRTVSKGRSMCMTCGHTLAAKDLVPIFSWLSLRGKCRYCKAPISSRYIKIESFTGLLFFIVSFTLKNSGFIVLYPSNANVQVLFARFILMIALLATSVAVMMIYHDTGKCFWGFPITMGGLILAYSISYGLIYNVLGYIIPFALLLYALSLVLSSIIYGLSKLLKLDFTRVDFMFDLTNTLLINSLLLLRTYISRSVILIIAVYSCIYLVVRLGTKNKKLNKIIGIVNVCAVVILYLLVYIITLNT